jgi:ribosomal protein L29
MKKKDLNDLRVKTGAEMDSLISKLRGEITKARLDLVTRKTKNVNVVKNLRKNLAQMLTIRQELK